MALTDSIIDNKWRFAIKRTFKFESVRYSIGLMANERKKETYLVKDLEKATKTANASQVKAKGLDINQYYEANHIGVFSGLHFVQWAARESEPLAGTEWWKSNVETISQLCLWRTIKVN